MKNSVVLAGVVVYRSEKCYYNDRVARRIPITYWNVSSLIVGRIATTVVWHVERLQTSQDG